MLSMTMMTLSDDIRDDDTDIDNNYNNDNDADDADDDDDDDDDDTGPFLLTLMLLDLLTADKTSHSRVINVSSVAHRLASPLN